jgi:hypothetical protein
MVIREKGSKSVSDSLERSEMIPDLSTVISGVCRIILDRYGAYKKVLESSERFQKC